MGTFTFPGMVSKHFSAWKYQIRGRIKANEPPCTLVPSSGKSLTSWLRPPVTIRHGYLSSHSLHICKTLMQPLKLLQFIIGRCNFQLRSECFSFASSSRPIGGPAPLWCFCATIAKSVCVISLGCLRESVETATLHDFRH